MTNKQKDTRCTIVVPVYNAAPKSNLQIVEDFQNICRLKPDIRFDLVIVEDGSEPNSSIDHKSVAKQISDFQYVSLPTNQGKGAALRAGVEKATGDIIIYTDNDFPYTADSIKLMIEALYHTNVQMAIGVRPQSYYTSIPRKRKMISKILQIMNSIFIKLPTSDTQAGLKGFKKEVTPLFLSTKVNGFLFDLEFLKLTKKRNIKTALIEVELRSSAILSTVKMNNLWEELKVYFGIVFN